MALKNANEIKKKEITEAPTLGGARRAVQEIYRAVEKWGWPNKGDADDVYDLMRDKNIALGTGKKSRPRTQV